MLQTEKPPPEPEISPRNHAADDTHPTQTFGIERVYVVTPGPFEFILVVLITGFLITVLFALLLATLLIWLPLLIFFVAGVIIGRIITSLLFSE